MTIRVHGGVFNDQVLTGDLRHFRIVGADFSGAVSDGSVILADVSYGIDGNNLPIPHYVHSGESVVGSAAEIVFVLLSTKGIVAIMNPTQSGLHFAMDANTGWVDAFDIQTVIRALGVGVGVDNLDLSNVEVYEVEYSFGNGLPADAEGYLYNNGVGDLSWDTTVFTGTTVIYATSVSDFPPATAGVRELTNGQSVVYVLTGGNTYDFGNDVLVATGGSCSIIGHNRFSHRLKTSASGTFMLSAGASFSLEKVFVECPNATAITMTPATGKALIIETVTFDNVARIADVTSSPTFLRKVTVFKTTVGGIRFFGSTSTMVVDGMFALSSAISPIYGYVGTLIDLGTAVFSFINIVPSSRFLSVVGNTVLSGLPSNGNLSASGRAIISNNIFEGTGTYLSGITTQDTRYDFYNNAGLSPSMADTLLTLTSNASVTNIITQNVPVKIAGTWVSQYAERFTNDNTGRATYVGIDPVHISIFATASIAPTSGTAINVGFYVVVNGTPVDYTLAVTAASAGSPEVVSTFCKMDFVTNTWVELWVVNLESNTDIIASNAKFIIE